MNEIKKLNPISLLGTLEANPENDAWIKKREKELAEQAAKEAAYQTQKRVETSGVPRRSISRKRRMLFLTTSFVATM